MAIIHARVDERLIHGQVAAVWTRITNAQRIAVVNDAAVHDDMQIGALKLARPTGVKLVIASVRRALITLTDGKYADERVFLLTKTIQDMRALVDGGVKLTTVNIGNVAPHDDAKQIKPSVYLNDADVADIKAMIAAGVKVTAQMVPTESDADITTMLK
ncbi:PTS system mannose/fructose/N-acetylgalactosamine-transporter subunit IIB [Lacticaseibacillus baoqingensis]|uniref:PTS system mannose/fructose/N-acetylgalactosamine-transporter subunit IIB n=1 Tax=Lacticaseibacillus baoqingensis TaxID=2486013 RepID=A0ABW4E1U3_9LACO|nr:PTS sugar transporter subunit IIB [Lacticaseibacillus baoqingensis]